MPVTRSPRNVVLLIALYLSTVLVGLQPVTDPDIWWHLRTGQWIVEHRAVPTVDPFSTYGQGKPWVVYSWLFDLVVYALYRVGGLRGISVYGFAACLAIMVSLHRLLGLAEPRPARAAALTALGFAALLPILSPRSYLVSILAFILVLHAVVRARRDGGARALLWLPLLFALWANVHIQFVYGLAVLALATLESALERWWDGGEPAPPSLRTWLLVDLACVLGTLVTPYHVRLYVVLREVAAQTGVYYFNLEMRAIQFRETWDWIALGLVLGAAYTVGRRSPPRFVALLSLAGVFVSFRSGRDVWFVVVCATLLIAMAGRPSEIPPPIGRGTRWRALTAVVVAFSLLLARQSAAGLEARVRREFPADAAQAVEQGRYAGPLYNHFNWGGYLLWRLPHLLVSMDGRSHVHGDARIVRSMRTWAGVGDWRSDPELGAAGVVIAGSDTPLATLLRHDPRFREVHADAVARAFVAATPPAAPVGARP